MRGLLLGIGLTIGLLPTQASGGPCGDVNADDAVTPADLAVLRGSLADPTGSALSIPGLDRCQVIASTVECSIVQVAVLARALASPPLPPGIADACADANPALGISPDPLPAFKKILTSAGSVLEAIATDGTQFALDLPPGAVVGSEVVEVSAQPLSDISGLPVSGGFLAGLQLAPEGLELQQPARLTVTLPAPVQVDELLTLAYRGTGNGAYFIPPLPPAPGSTEISSFEVLVSHFSGVGAATGDRLDIFFHAPPPIPEGASFEQALALATFGGTVDVPAVRSALVNEFDQLVLPKLQTVGSCPSLPDATNAYLDWETEVQWVGLDSETDFAVQIAAGRVALQGTQELLEADVQALDAACQASPEPCDQQALTRDALACYVNADALSVVAHEPVGISNPPPAAFCPGIPALLAIEPDHASVCVDEQVGFSAQIKGLNGDLLPGAPHVWESGDASVVSVEESTGVATAVGEGASKVLLRAGCEVSTWVPFEVGASHLEGVWEGRGSETVVFCGDENGTDTGAQTFEITLEDDLPDGTIAFAGNGVHEGDSFAGTTLCDGTLSGSGTYSNWDPVNLVLVTGTLQFQGEILHSTGDETRIAKVVYVDFQSSGDPPNTCQSFGWGVLTPAP